MKMGMEKRLESIIRENVKLDMNMLRKVRGGGLLKRDVGKNRWEYTAKKTNDILTLFRMALLYKLIFEVGLYIR